MGFLGYIFFFFYFCTSVFASPTREEGLLALAQKGILFKEQRWSGSFELAYFTAGYDYSSGIKGGEREIPAQIFLVDSGHTPVPEIQGFLKHRFPSHLIPHIEALKPARTDSFPLDFFAKGRLFYSISQLFPATVLKYLGRPGQVVHGNTYCSNCYGAAKAFHTGGRVDHLDEEDLHSFVQSRGSRNTKEAPQFGDILIFPKYEHASVFLFDGLVFQKPTWNPNHEYEIVPYESMFATLNRAIQAFSKGMPAGSSRPSLSDIFVSSLQGATPRQEPPAWDSQDVKVLRPLGCLEALE